MTIQKHQKYILVYEIYSFVTHRFPYFFDVNPSFLSFCDGDMADRDSL